MRLFSNLTFSWLFGIYSLILNYLMVASMGVRDTHITPLPSVSTSAGRIKLKPVASSFFAWDLSTAAAIRKFFDAARSNCCSVVDTHKHESPRTRADARAPISSRRHATRSKGRKEATAGRRCAKRPRLPFPK